MVERRQPGHYGLGRLGCVVLLALLGLAVSVAIPFLRAEIRFRSAQDRIREEAMQLDVDRVSEVQEELAPVIVELGLPPSAQRIYVRPAGGGMGRYRLTARYADTLRIFEWERIILRTIVAETP